MKSSQTTAHRSCMQVDDAFDAASKLVGENFKVNEELLGAAMILSGLLTLAFILEGKDESPTQ